MYCCSELDRVVVGACSPTFLSFLVPVYYAEELTPHERAAAERDVQMMKMLSHPNVLRTLGHKYASSGRLLLYVE